MFIGLLQFLQGFFWFGYLSGSNSFPKPLTAEEERIHLDAYAKGDEDAKNILVERNLRLVAHVAKKYVNHSKDNEDLISVGTIGLMKAITTYKPDKGTRLATYAARCIDNAILFYVTHITPFLSPRKIYIWFRAFQEDVYYIAFDDYTFQNSS